jgi:hypothetical protein
VSRDTEYNLQERSRAGSPSTATTTSHAPEAAKAGTDWLRLASSAPAVFAFLGLIVYGVVRVGHDAFYAKFGVTAEEVGLSQTTILGRAALYFVFFLTVAVALVGISVTITQLVTPLEARLSTGGETARERASGAFRARVGVDLLTLAAGTGFGAAIVAGLEGSWPLALTIGMVVPLAIVAYLGVRLPRRQRAMAGLLFAGVIVWSASVAFVVATLGTESDPGAASLSGLWRWLLLSLCVMAAATASVSLLRQFESRSTLGDGRGSASPERYPYLVMLSLLALLPLALVFVAPGVGRFITETNIRTAAAAAMWAILFGFVVLGFQVLWGRRRGQRPLAVDVVRIILLASLFAATALYLASERGVDLANQVLAGSRVTQSGFGTFSVRADIVCLESLQGPDAQKQLPKSPVIYLGQSANNELVLFDLERREKLRAREDVLNTDIGAPDLVPLRLPASDVMLRVANLIKPGNPYVVPVTVNIPTASGKAEKHTFQGKWSCLPSR